MGLWVEESGQILNFEKCEFNLKEIKLFGVILSAEGIRTDPDKVTAAEKIKYLRIKEN